MFSDKEDTAKKLLKEGTVNISGHELEIKKVNPPNKGMQGTNLFNLNNFVAQLSNTHFGINVNLASLGKISPTYGDKSNHLRGYSKYSRFNPGVPLPVG